jgi:hypothetical protein
VHFNFSCSSTGYVHTGIDDFKTFFFHKNGKNFEQSEFVVVKVFRSGSQLEIIPIYMSFRGRKEEIRVLFLNESYSKSILEVKSLL